MSAEFDDDLKYLIVSPDNGGIWDLLNYTAFGNTSSRLKFLDTPAPASASANEQDRVLIGDEEADHRWVIAVSIIVRKIIAFFGKPLQFTGYVVDFILNLLFLNGNFTGLLYNLFHGKVVIPHRGTDTFLSTIGHLDGRIDLYHDHFSETMKLGNRALMDLCIMASKLAYENAHVVKNVVVHHWNMHFVDFYNCWNDFQKQRSTQVFILCDKPIDASLILISFRGTEPFDADDWITDFDYSWYDIPKLGKVHMGFLEALGLGNRTHVASFHYHLQSSASARPEMLDSEMTAYYTVKNKLKSLLNQHKNAKFLVTGHSLGGALAILFPTVLVLHEEMEMIQQRLLGVYTFGQPRIGNRQLGRFMKPHLESPVPKYFRVVYCNDMVPRLPYDDKTFLYKHFGVCLYYDSFYVEQKVDEEPNKNYFGLWYVIPEYMNAVWELIRGLTMGYTHGAEYKESWFSICLRIIGLAFPGISAHCPTNYVNSVRLGKERHSVLQMSSL